MENQNVIYGINGPVVTVKNTKSFSMMEMVYVGKSRLVGEVIGINENSTIIQVYEETTGLKPGEKIYGTGGPMCVTLGPGIIDNIFDECLYNIYFATPGGFIEEKTVVALRPLDKLNTERKIKGFLRDLETFELGVACELGDDKIIVFIWE